MALTNISIGVFVPGVYFEIESRSSGLAVQPHEVLLIGQIGAGATMTPNTIYEVDAASEALALAGSSQLSQMFAAYRGIDTLTPVSIVGVADDGDAEAATGKITIAGTSEENRALALYVSGQRVVLSVAKGDEAEDIAAKAVAAFASQGTNYPVIVTVDEADIIFDAVNAGEASNSIQIGHSQLAGERPPLGVTVTVTQMAGGTADAGYAAALAAISGAQFNTIALGSSDPSNVTLVVAELENRWLPLQQIDGVAFVGRADTRQNLSTYKADFNSGLLYVLGLEKSALLDPPWVIAAKVAARSAQQAQVDPSLHPTGDILTGSRAAKKGTRFSFDQRNTLLRDGISTLAAAPDGSLAIERLVSTYTLNSQGLPDSALKDLAKVRTLSAMRFDFRAKMSSRYAKAKLMDDSPILPQGQTIMTPSLMRAEAIASAQGWIDAGWMEGAALPLFKKKLIVRRSDSDSARLEALLPVDVVDQLFIVAGRLSAEG